MQFTEKNKEPGLSLGLKKIIARSHGEDNGENYDDIDRYKYRIMKILTSNGDILRTLHNKELEEKVPTLYLPEYLGSNEADNTHNGDIYRNVNIFNYLKIPNIQDNVKNFICFEVDDVEKVSFVDNMIVKNVTFRTISYKDDCITDYGIPRQDLLGIIIKNKFDWTNQFGMHFLKINDEGRVSEDGYYYREIVYQIYSPNNTYNEINNL